MSSNEKVINVLGDRKEEVIPTPWSEKKSSTKDVEKGTDELADMPLTDKKYSKNHFDKGTDELADMKQALVTICSKGLDQFDCQSIEYKGCFKFDSGVLKTKCSTIHSEFYK